MSEKRKMKLEKGSGIRSVLLSTAIGIVVFAILSVVCAIIIMNSNIEIEKIKYFLGVISVVSSFISALLSGFMNRQMKGLVIGLLTSVSLSIIILLTVLLMNGGAVSALAFITIILSVAVGLPAGIIGANLK